MLSQAVPVLSICSEVNQLVSQFKNKTELLETWSKKQNLQSVYGVVCDSGGNLSCIFPAVEFRLLNTQITPNFKIHFMQRLVFLVESSSVYSIFLRVAAFKLHMLSAHTTQSIFTAKQEVG